MANLDDGDAAAVESEPFDIDFLIAPRVAVAALEADVDALVLSASKRLFIGTPLRVAVADAVEQE